MIGDYPGTRVSDRDSGAGGRVSEDIPASATVQAAPTRRVTAMWNGSGIGSGSGSRCARSRSQALSTSVLEVGGGEVVALVDDEMIVVGDDVVHLGAACEALDA